MATTNTPTQIAGDFKNLYKSSGLVNAIPQWALVQDRFAFEEAEAGTGQYYIFGVVLQKEQGFTYAPSSGTGSGIVALNSSVAGFIGQAQVEGYSIYLRSRLSYDAAAKASRAGKKAFAQAYGAVLKNMKESHQYRLECSLLFGRNGLGIVSSNTSGALVITDATWSQGTFASGMKDAVLEAWTTTAASATQHNGDLVITAVDVSTKTVTVSGTSAAVVANDILYFKGARTSTGYNEAPSLYSILLNTGSLFNIDASAYELWKSQSYAVGGAISLTAIMSAAARAMPYGLTKGLLFITPAKFASLASDEAALRRYIQNPTEVKRGVKGISFMMGSVDIEVLPHPLMRDSLGFLLSESSIHRCGASDITFALPGQGEDMTVQVTDFTAVEIRSLCDQGIFSDSPAQNVLLTGIT